MNTNLNAIALAACMRSEWLIACLAAMDAGSDVCLFKGFGQ